MERENWRVAAALRSVPWQPLLLSWVGEPLFDKAAREAMTACAPPRKLVQKDNPGPLLSYFYFIITVTREPTVERI